MDHGRLVQVATPDEIYERPNSRWVADFIGEVNLIEGRVDDVDPALDSRERERPAAARAVGADAQPGDAVWVALRPEKMRIAHERAGRRRRTASPAWSARSAISATLSIYKVRLDSGTSRHEERARRQCDDALASSAPIALG